MNEKLKLKFSIEYAKLFVKMLVLILAVGLLIGCSSSSEKSDIISGRSILPIANKTSASAESKNRNEIKMLGVLTYVDTSNLTMYFADVESGSEYEVKYTGGTDILNKYKTVIAASQLVLGDVFDLTCNKSGKAIKIYESSDVWETSDVTNFSVNEATRIMNIGSNSYKYSAGLVIISNGVKIKANEIMSQDVLTVHGNENNIYSISVDKGHGYVKLTGYKAFLGGYVDIGTKLILRVSENMVITAPEGEYKVSMQLGSLQGSKTVVIKRDQDVTVDFSEYKEKVIQAGAILFSLTPSSAVMYIDGIQVDYSKELQLNYGSHTVVLKANNYTTYTETFIVKTTYEKKVIDMTPASSSTTATTAVTSADLTSGYMVNIKAPEGAAVYLDNVYVGMIPISFKKSSGNKVITLTKAGTTTKSFTVSIANAVGDLNYSFPEMEDQTVTTKPTQ